MKTSDMFAKWKFSRIFPANHLIKSDFGFLKKEFFSILYHPNLTDPGYEAYFFYHLADGGSFIMRFSAEKTCCNSAIPKSG